MVGRRPWRRPCAICSLHFWARSSTYWVRCFLYGTYGSLDIALLAQQTAGTHLLPPPVLAAAGS